MSPPFGRKHNMTEKLTFSLSVGPLKDTSKDRTIKKCNKQSFHHSIKHSSGHAFPLIIEINDHTSPTFLVVKLYVASTPTYHYF